jgi:hypothetical protein
LKSSIITEKGPVAIVHQPSYQEKPAVCTGENYPPSFECAYFIQAHDEQYDYRSYREQDRYRRRCDCRYHQRQE